MKCSECEHYIVSTDPEELGICNAGGDTSNPDEDLFCAEAEEEFEEVELTWKQFKDKVEAAGITNDMMVTYIDWDDNHDPDVHIWKDGRGFRVE